MEKEERVAKREIVKVEIGDEKLAAMIEDGEVTGFRPISIAHLNKDRLGCITYITLIGNAMTKTGR
ncbi:hypothetical protein ES708_00062 [subsurface metagenome]